MKEFKVVPFTPTHKSKGRLDLNDVAFQLENHFRNEISDNWEYVRVETITSRVPSRGGCFGFFKDPAFDLANHFIVFSREL